MVDGFIEAMHAVLGRGEAVITPSRKDHAPATPEGSQEPVSHASIESPRTDADASTVSDEHDIARQLSATLDRAMEMEQWAFAERIAAQAMRIAKHYPLLAERIARLRAAQGEFETALTIIDSCSDQPASTRLLRTVCLLQLGRRHEAHGDLHRWARKATAPLAARLMLALLEWEDGDGDFALAALRHNLRQIEDPNSLAALTLIATAQKRGHVATRWSQRLHRAISGHPQAVFYQALLTAIGQSAPAATSEIPSPASAVTLAGELLGREDVIPALTEAACLAQDQPRARLLIDALSRIVDDLDDQAMACDALGQLHELLGEHDLAEGWRSRGVEAGERGDVLASIGHRGVSAPQPMVWERAA